jgi:hypothetical protein
MDWNKLRDQCGVYLQKHQWKGETYVSLYPAKDGPLDYKLVVGLMGAITTGKEPFCLWGADARTLIMEGESGVKTAIEAKLNHAKQTPPRYAAGWDLVSHGFLAVAFNNQDQRLFKRTVSRDELTAALKEPTSAEAQLVRIYENTNGIVLGLRGDDNLRFDCQVAAATPEATSTITECLKKLVVAGKKRVAENETKPKVSDDPEEAMERFVNKVVNRFEVDRSGTVVTIHAEVPSGLNALLAELARVPGAAKKK